MGFCVLTSAATVQILCGQEGPARGVEVPAQQVALHQGTSGTNSAPIFRELLFNASQFIAQHQQLKYLDELQELI